MEPETVYKVITEGDCEGKSLTVIGYARGNKRDIETYFEKEKEYTIILRPIKIHDVNPETIKEKKDLLEERKNLEQRLKEIKEWL